MMIFDPNYQEKATCKKWNAIAGKKRAWQSCQWSGVGVICCIMRCIRGCGGGVRASDNTRYPGTMMAIRTTRGIINPLLSAALGLEGLNHIIISRHVFSSISTAGNFDLIDNAMVQSM